jgi:hypothetical protein
VLSVLEHMIGAAPKTGGAGRKKKR